MKEILPSAPLQAIQKAKKKNTLKENTQQTSILFNNARCIEYRYFSDVSRKGIYRVKYPHFFLLFNLEGRISIQSGDQEERCINQDECLCTYHDHGDYKLGIFPGQQRIVTLVFEHQLLLKPDQFPSIYPVIEAMLQQQKGITSLPVLKMSTAIRRTIEQLLSLSHLNGHERNQKANKLILKLVQYYHEGINALQQHPSLTLASLIKIYLDEHLDKPQLQVKLLYTQFPSTERTMQRKFQEAYGCSIKSYIIKARMDRAIQLLKEYAAIDQILPKIGYVDQHSFSVQFKKHHGFPPSAVV